MSYKNIDTIGLRKMVSDFEFYSQPSNADASATCTNQDLKNVISRVAYVLYNFINELED